MTVGIPREIKNNENRVSIAPAGVYALRKNSHSVLIEQGAGLGSGIRDSEYTAAGAIIVPSAKEVYTSSDLILKVKEPIGHELDMLKEGQALFTYLHLAAEPALAKVLIGKKITAIGYETVQLANGSLPLLAPMSEVAGRMSIQVGANLLLKYNGGEGILLGSVPGVAPAEVLIIGGGNVGTNAGRMAVGLGARVTIMDISAQRLAYLDELFEGRVTTLHFSEYSAAKLIKNVDLLIGAVLVPGSKTPKLVSEEMVKSMKRGSVIVDVAIDQGGSIATSDRVSTHDNPSYEKYGVLHYSVANMPGAVPKTATYALTGVTLSYVEKLANQGIEQALLDDEALLKGLNTYKGAVTCKPVADALGLPSQCPREALGR